MLVECEDKTLIILLWIVYAQSVIGFHVGTDAVALDRLTEANGRTDLIKRRFFNLGLVISRLLSPSSQRFDDFVRIDIGCEEIKEAEQGDFVAIWAQNELGGFF